MLDKEAIIKRVDRWQKTHPPDTGYARGVATLVLRESTYPAGTNLLTEFMAQFTGREEPGIDHTTWDRPERRLPYSQTSRWSLDWSGDCSSATNLWLRMFFGVDIGSWTEAQYKKLKGKEIPWNKRRVGDVILWNFKLGRNVSHAGIMAVDPKEGKRGQICHTTSPSNPLRFESDDYQAHARVGCYRVLTDQQYRSLFVSGLQPDPIFQHAMWYHRAKLMEGDDVAHYQATLKDYLASKSDPFARSLASILKVNGTYGLTTYWAVKVAQWHLGLPATGGIDRTTAATLDNL